jgi:hypothetical protein
MTTKTFAVAGTSNLHGVIKARFAKDMMRIKVLDAGGHTEVNLIELPTAMTKSDAASHLIDINFDAGNAAVRAALYAEIDRAAGVKSPKAAAVAAVEAEEELQTVIVDDVITADEAHEMAAFADGDDTALDRMDQLVAAAHEIAADMKMPVERALSMTPAAVKKRAARAAAKQTTPGAERFQEWAAAANAEEAAEEADIQF